MMKKNTVLLLASLLWLATANAQDHASRDERSWHIDQPYSYAKLLGGANFVRNATTDGNQTTFDAGYIVAGMLGHCWPCCLCLEAEFAFRRNGIQKIDFYIEDCSDCGHFQTFSFMANLLWDLPVSSWTCGCWHVQPFVGVGLGYDFQQMNASNSRIIFYQQWNCLSWQAMAGLTYPIWRNTDMTFEYKFHQGGRHFYNQSVGVGLAYNW